MLLHHHIELQDSFLLDHLKHGVEKQHAKRIATTTNGVGTVNLDTTTTTTGDAEIPF